MDNSTIIGTANFRVTHPPTDSYYDSVQTFNLTVSGWCAVEQVGKYQETRCPRGHHSEQEQFDLGHGDHSSCELSPVRRFFLGITTKISRSAAQRFPGRDLSTT